jgi:hypothetical protein
VCGTVLLHKHFLYGLCNSNRAHVEGLAARRAGKEIAFEYSSDSDDVLGYNSDSSYEFDFGSDPIEFQSELKMTEEPLSGHAAVLFITSTPADKFIYRPDCKPVDVTDDKSHCIAYLETLPFQEGTPLAPLEDEHTPPRWRLRTSASTPLTVKSSWQPEMLEPRKTDPTGISMTSQGMSCQPTHLPSSLPNKRTLGATAIGSGPIDADVPRKISPSGTSMRL